MISIKRGHIGVALLALVVPFFVACSHSDKAATSSSAAPRTALSAAPTTATASETSAADTPTPTAVPQAPSVQTKLLLPEQVGAGWVVATTDPRIGHSGQGGPECLSLMDVGTTAPKSASVAMTPGDSASAALKGENFYQTIGVFASVADAQAQLAKAVAAMGSCSSISFGTDTQRATGSMASLPLPAAGDQSYGFKLSLMAGGIIPIGAAIELIRQGSTLLSLYKGEYSATVDSSQLPTLASKALARI